MTASLARPAVGAGVAPVKWLPERGIGGASLGRITRARSNSHTWASSRVGVMWLLTWRPRWIAQDWQVRCIFMYAHPVFVCLGTAMNNLVWAPNFTFPLSDSCAHTWQALNASGRHATAPTPPHPAPPRPALPYPASVIAVCLPNVGTCMKAHSPSSPLHPCTHALTHAGQVQLHARPCPGPSARLALCRLLCCPWQQDHTPGSPHEGKWERVASL